MPESEAQQTSHLTAAIVRSVARPARPAGPRGLVVAMLALMGGAGITHFTNPAFYDPIVPRWMPGPARAWTYASGVAELACAGLMARGRTRRAGGWASFATILAVWPANWQVALDGGIADAKPPMNSAAVNWARVPMQLPMLWGALRVARGS